MKTTPKERHPQKLRWPKDECELKNEDDPENEDHLKKKTASKKRMTPKISMTWNMTQKILTIFFNIIVCFDATFVLIKIFPDTKISSNKFVIWNQI